MGLNIRKIKLQLFTVVSLDGRIVAYFSLYIFYFIFPHVCKKEQTNKEIPHKYDVKILPLLFGKAKRLKEPLLMSLLNLWQVLLRDVGGNQGTPTLPQPCDRPLQGTLTAQQEILLYAERCELMELMAAVSVERIQVENRNGFKKFGKIAGWQFCCRIGECVCVWYVWGCLWPWARYQRAAILFLGARTGSLSWQSMCVCALVVTQDLYVLMLSCIRDSVRQVAEECVCFALAASPVAQRMDSYLECRDP